ncbi:hypothetical protein KFK09_029472 [Dendrobium nobile]|uniref:noroxomaritidine synthase n=1 Tax=Dendrobium nobile TaxID=94219 RepID=A0A8T2ZZZ9_DENNO|nr:hypothetical protein KFK09_029472 [Dendrobium nobile]
MAVPLTAVLRTPAAEAVAAFALLLIAAVALKLVLLWRKLPRSGRSSEERRKKMYAPVAGTVFHHLLNFGRLYDFSTSCARQNPTYRILSPFHSEVYTADPANVEYILKTNFTNYGKGDYNYCTLKDLLGDGIFAVDGEKWWHQRKMASLVFSKRIFKEYSSIVFRGNALKLVSVIAQAARSNSRMDIQDIFMKSSMDSIFQVAFGVELNSLSGSNEEERKFTEAFDEANVLISWRYVDPLWKMKKFLNFGCEAELKNRLKVVDDFVYKILTHKVSQSSKQLQKEDILSRLLIEREQDPKNITYQYLRDITLNFLVAGRDSTALTLSWFFYRLCLHASIEEKVVREVNAVTKLIHHDEPIAMDVFTASLTDELIEKMEYLHATITETMRLHPAVPLDPKICFSDDTLPDGHDVRKGDMVAYMPYAMGRMRSIWGDDAEVFLPERWLKDGVGFVHESPYKFTAFQGGPRICLGKDMAYRQMKIFAVTLLHFFKFKLSDENRLVKYRTMLTLQIENGLLLHAIPRQGHDI